MDGTVPTGRSELRPLAYAWVIVGVLGLLSAVAPVASQASAAAMADDVIDAAVGAKKWGGAGRSLRAIQPSDLRFGTKVDNVNGLLESAVDEQRLTDTQMIRLAPIYKELDRGDQLLLVCLRNSACDPAVFAGIVRTSALHAEVAVRRPALGVVQANHEVGSITERMMDRFYRDTGWTRIEGQVGRTGMDGLYVKTEAGIVKDVLVVESKYNTSVLKETNFGTQMSETWLLKKMQELHARYPDETVYEQVDRYVETGIYRAELWNLKVEDGIIRIRLDKLKSKGSEVKFAGPEAIIGTKATPVSIRIDSPTTNFQRKIVTWYRSELDAVGPAPL